MPVAQPSADLAPRRRGRPAKEDAGAIDARILAAARALFVAEGFRRTSMEAVQGAAGVAKATLYLRYPDKKALFRAVIIQVAQEIAPPSPERFDSLSACIAHQIEFHLTLVRRPELLAVSQALDGGVADADEAARATSLMLRDAGMGSIEQALRTTARASGQTLRDPPLLAQLVFAAWTGQWERERLTGQLSPAATRQFAAKVADMLVHGAASA